MAIPANHPGIQAAIANGLLPAAMVVGPKKRKYRNKPCEHEGERFDSVREKDRWILLRVELERGTISDLRRQVRYTLAVNKVWICDYIADFTYQRDGKLVVEDSKGVRTPEYKLKARLMQAIYKIEIQEV